MNKNSLQPPIKIKKEENKNESHSRKGISRLAKQTIIAFAFYVAVPIVLLICFSIPSFANFFGLSGIVLFGIVMCCGLSLFAITSLAIENYKLKQLQKARLLAVMKLRAKERAKVDIDAQLKKPAFEERLVNYLGTPIQESEPIVNSAKSAKSQAPFWQAEDIQPVKTPARPSEFFRMLLQRISKLVGMTKGQA